VAHIERRCTRGHAVPRGRACGRCGATEFSYRVRYINPEGRERSRSFKRKADADDFTTEVSHALRSSSYIDPAAGRQPLKAYLAEWASTQVHWRSSTRHSYEASFKLVSAHLGALPLSRLTASAVAAWMAKLTETHAPSTIALARVHLSSALNAAVRDRRLAANPARGVKPPEVVREKVVPRTVAQVRAAQAAAPKRYAAVVPLVAGTGLRWSEAFGLTVDRIDFLRRAVRIDRQLVDRDGAEPLFGPPKTATSDRELPLPETVIQALAAHLAAFPAQPHELVFRTRGGRPVSQSGWGKQFERARAAMGLSKGDGLHHLRHFYASLLIADGRSVKEVQERLGHATAKETLDTYSHLWPGADDGTRAAIDKAFAAADETPEQGSEEDAR